MPNNEGLFKAWINPLAFLEVDLPSAGKPDSISAETILSFLCPPGTPDDAGSLVERYKRISTGPRLFAAPAEPRILEKLVWPLRHAKASYVVGNNLSVVALCGMVAEMVALLLWQLAETKLNEQTVTESDEKALFGRSFEKLGQERRVEILKAYGIITSDLANHFGTIRATRRQYLHLWSHDHRSLQEDAVKCFHAATRLVIEAIGHNMEDGKIVLHPRLVKYLAREGVFEAHQDSAV